MFVGHTALALAAKAREPKLSLGWLVAASFWIDLVWPVLLILGVERVRVEPGSTAFTPLAFESYPWTHSLMLVLLWGAAFGLAFVARSGPRAAVLLGALVVSHWLLDLASHRPDLPLWPGTSPLLGLGLWYSVPATFLVEGTLLAIGLALYLRTTTPLDKAGSVAFFTFLGLQIAIWAAGPFAPPPPSATAVGWAALITWLLPFWAGWADRHRRTGIA